MEVFRLVSLITNNYKIQTADLSLRLSRVTNLYLVTSHGRVLIAPAYPEGYLSIDLSVLDHLIWSSHERIFVQRSSDRRYFELVFRDPVGAASFVALLKDLRGEDLIEHIRTPIEMDVISTSWSFGRVDASTVESEPIEQCSLSKTSCVSPIGSPPTTPPSSPLTEPGLLHGKVGGLQTPFPSPTSARKPKSRAATKICNSYEDTLEHIYQTGAYSDLTIVAGGRRFNVHKAIVCPRSHFFAKALDGEFQEAESSIITLEESSAVAEVILQYVYGQEIVSCRPPLATTFSGQTEQARRAEITLMMDVYVAADKYGIANLQHYMVHAVNERLPWLKKPESLTGLARYIYETTPYHDGQVCEMREAVAAFLQDHLKAVLQDPKGASAMLENHGLMFDILQRTVEDKQTPNKLSASLKRAREEARDERAEERRSTLRPRQHGPGAYKDMINYSKA